jgi:hypothetical protein
MALVADVKLVLEDELQKLAVVEPAGGRLLEANGEAAAEAGQAKQAERGVELGGDHVGKARR